MPRRTRSRPLTAAFAHSLAILWLGLAGASATAAGTTYFGLDSHKHFIERVNRAQGTDYRAVLALYEEHRLAAPDDVISQIERCRFIQNFAYSEDGTIESAGEDLEACRAELEASPHKNDIDVVLFNAESWDWDEHSLDKLRALIPAKQSWTDMQMARLMEMLAQRSRASDEAAAGGYAIRAIDFNPGSSALMQALERYRQIGAKRKIRQAIIAAPDSVWKTQPRTQAAQILIDIGETDMAVQLLQDAEGKNEYGVGLMLARALAAKGEYAESARRYREEIAASKYVTTNTRLEYFQLELAHGTEKDALAAYESMQSADADADAIGRYRMSLVAAYPHLIWDSRTLRALLAILVMALIVCLVPLVVIIPIHYRGLARRAHGRAPDLPGGGWTLRHAWYASAAFFLASTAAVYVLTPAILMSYLPSLQYTPVTDPSDMQLAKVMLWSTIATLIVLLPLLRGQPLKALLLGRWSIKRSIFVGLGLAFAFKVVAVLVGLGLKSAGALGSSTTRTIQGAGEAYGWFGMLLLAGVLTPVVEEFVFRGVLLRAFRGQVSFWFAALMQAAAFTLIHEERESMAFLFAMALTMGWLVKRSEGLLAPIVMHCVNNVTAGLAIIGITAALNR